MLHTIPLKHTLKWLAGRMLAVPVGAIPVAIEAGDYVCLMAWPAGWITWNPKTRARADLPESIQAEVLKAHAWNNLGYFSIKESPSERKALKGLAESMGWSDDQLARLMDGSEKLTPADGVRLLHISN